VLGFVIDAWFFRGTRLPFISEAWTVLAAPAVIQATVNGLLRRGNSAFTVTDKGRSRDRTVVHWRVLWPFALIAVLTLAGMLKSVLDPFDEIGSQNFTPVAYLWSIYNLVILFFVFLTCIEFPRQRRADRYPARESVRVEAAGRMDTALLLDLSIDGGRLRCDDELEVGGIVQVELAQVGRVRAQLVRRITTMEYGVRWMADAEQRRCLILRVYGSDAKPVRSGDVFRLIGLTFRRLAH
jgi:cellulose synthase (UDP-forming)